MATYSLFALADSAESIFRYADYLNPKNVTYNSSFIPQAQLVYSNVDLYPLRVFVGNPYGHLQIGE